MKRFSIIKPVENHPEHICCTECWQRGIQWGGAGEQERIITILESISFLEDYPPFNKTIITEEAIKLIRENNDFT